MTHQPVSDFSDSIREINLTYLMLAHQMVQENTPIAMFKLGIDKDVAEIISKLTPAQIIRLAATPVMICNMRIDVRTIEALTSGYSTKRLASDAQAAILIGQSTVAAVA